MLLNLTILLALLFSSWQSILTEQVVLSDVLWAETTHIEILQPVYTFGTVNAVDPMEEDTSNVVVRTPQEGALAVYKNNPDFIYLEQSVESLSLWDQIKRWFFDTISELFSDTGDGNFWWRILQVIAFGILILAFLRLLKMDAGGLLNPKSPPARGLIQLDDEILRDTDFLSLADEVRRQGNLRLASRMYYMHVLKVLDENEAIRWMPRKTNQDYLVECRLANFRPAFARLTYLFDYAWYGDFPVDAGVVEEMKTLALSVEQKQQVG